MSVRSKEHGHGRRGSGIGKLVGPDTFFRMSQARGLHGIYRLRKNQGPHWNHLLGQLLAASWGEWRNSHRRPYRFVERIENDCFLQLVPCPPSNLMGWGLV